MTFAPFEVPSPGDAGFRVVAGREDGLRRLMVISGRLPVGDVGPVHVHHGDEVLRVVSGDIDVRCGALHRTCGPGDLVIVPADTPHGFRVRSETVLEVVAEYDIGTLYPVIGADGSVSLVEVHRHDMPWGRAPQDGASWTSDEELRDILDRLAYEI